MGIKRLREISFRTSIIFGVSIQAPLHCKNTLVMCKKKSKLTAGSVEDSQLFLVFFLHQCPNLCIIQLHVFMCKHKYLMLSPTFKQQCALPSITTMLSTIT